MNDLDSLLSGEVTLTTDHSNPELKGPFLLQLRWPTLFRQQRQQVDGTAFPKLVLKDMPPISLEFDGLGIGRFNPATGQLELPIKLKLKYPLGRARVKLTLSTSAAGGVPVSQADGSLTLVARGVFVDPLVLNGVSCTLSLQARLAPNPHH